MDLNGDGMVDKHEFLVGAADYQKVATKENIKRAFSLFDIDKDGQIDLNEFKYAFPQDESQTASDQKNDNRWLKIMMEYDEDRSGTISLEEFTKAMNTFVTEEYDDIASIMAKIQNNK